MKKILLATTILGLSAGYAAADISWGGSAKAGIASNGTTNGGVADPNTFGKTDDAFHVYSNVNLAVTFSGTSDSGLTFGATFDTTAGTSYALADDDGFDSNGGSFGMPTVFIEGSFGKLSFSDDNMDFYDDATTDSDGDVSYSGTFGAVNVGLMADVDGNAMAAKIGYSAGKLTLSADYNQLAAGADAGLVNDLWNIGVDFAVSDALTVSVTAGNDGDAANATNETLKVAYSNNGISASAAYNTSDESIDLTAGYSRNSLSVDLSVDDVSDVAANGYTVWTLKGAYDLGGGLSVEAGTNYTQDMMLGAKMSF